MNINDGMGRYSQQSKRKLQRYNHRFLFSNWAMTFYIVVGRVRIQVRDHDCCGIRVCELCLVRELYLLSVCFWYVDRVGCRASKSCAMRQTVNSYLIVHNVQTHTIYNTETDLK
jgi:hypothetical protein